MWILSPDAALHLFEYLLAQPLFIHTQSTSPVSCCLVVACNELFRRVSSECVRLSVWREWASALLLCATSALANLSHSDALHPDLDLPLQSCSSALGSVTRVRIERLADQLAASARAGLFGMCTLSTVTPEQYLQQFTEAVSRSFLSPIMSAGIVRSRETELPNLTTVDREQARTRASLTIMGEMMLRSCHRSLTPPFSDAVGLDIYTVTSMLSVWLLLYCDVDGRC